MRARYDKQSTFSLAMAKIRGKPNPDVSHVATVTIPDVYQSDGVIHVVSAVLLPN
jgi:uncharacterized surface protein with fasciclin (FAS1) repeats